MKYIGIVWFIMLLIVLPFKTPGAEMGKGHQFMRQLSMNDGLPSNAIYAIFKDSRGILWLGTDAGLVRYDGVSFSGFPMQEGIAGERITAVTEDEQGDLWIASQGVGLLHYTGDAFDIIDLGIFGLENNILSLKYLPEVDRLFVGTTNGFAVHSFKEVISYSPLKGNLEEGIGICNFLDQDKCVRLITQKGTALCLDLQSMELEQISKSKILQSNQSGNFVPGTLLQDKNCFVTGRVMARTVDSDGILWMLISEGEEVETGGQLFVFDGQNLLPKTDTFELSSYQLETLFYDEEEDLLWLGTHDNGLIQIPNSPFTYFEKNNLVDDNEEIVDVVAGLKGKTYIAFTSKLVEFDGKVKGRILDRTRFEKVYLCDSIEIDQLPLEIFSLEKDKSNRLWIATNYGFFVLNRHLKYAGIQPAEKFLIDSKNRLLYLWKNKLKVLGGPHYRQVIDSFEFRGAVPMKFSKMISRGDEVWMASKSFGLIRYSSDGFQVFNRRNSEIHNVINDIVFDEKGRLIAGGNNGVVYHLVYDKGQLKVLRTLAENNGLAGTSVHGFQKEGTRYLWVGTNWGIHRIDLNSWYTKDTVDNLFWDEKEGYYDRTGINSTKDEKGNIWVQTPQRWLRINTNIVKPRKGKDRKVVLQQILINNKKLEIAGNKSAWSKIPSELLELKNSQKYVSFYFGIQNYLNPEKNRYRYKLEGFDEQWSQWSAQGYAVFSNLSHGKYVLQVEGKNLNKGKARSLEFPFTVLPPWYASWWFYLLLTFIVLGLLGSGFYTYGCYVKKKEGARNKVFKRVVRLKIRALQAQMDPHFTFNALNSIQSYILEENTEAAMDYLSDFSVILRKNYDNATRELISLSEELSYLNSYIKLEELRFPDKFNFQLEVDGQINARTIKLPPMLIQPFLEIAIRHGLSGKKEKGNLKLSFTLDSVNYLHCSIEDNGIGRHQAKRIEHGRHINSNYKAVQLTRDRIKLLNHIIKNGRRFHVEVTDLVDAENNASGTRVNIAVPLKN